MPNETWDFWWPTLYNAATKPQSYPGNPDSYMLAGEFLSGDGLIEEWGCATTWGKQFLKSPYRGVDGGISKFVDQVADLRMYRSTVPKILIRHVLEHNWEWRQILANVMASFYDRAAIILFIPLGTHDINRSFEHREGEAESPPGLQMDEMSFENMLYIPGIRVETKVLSNNTPPFGYEKLYFLTKASEVMGYARTATICTIPGCKEEAEGQIRSDYVVLDNRFQYAFNVCHPHQVKALDSLYSLQTPDVSF